MNKNLTIEIPKGTFEIDRNCSTCIYANLRDRDKYGRVKCQNSDYGGYNHPKDRNGCFHHKPIR